MNYLFELGPPAVLVFWLCQCGSILQSMCDPYLLAQGNFD